MGVLSLPHSPVNIRRAIAAYGVIPAGNGAGMRSVGCGRANAIGGVMKLVDTLVIARDMGKCARCLRHVAHLDRGVEWSIHHRRPRGQGGTSLGWVDAPANLLVLCGSGVTGCHGWVESNRKDARADGFLVSLNGVLRADEVEVRHGLLGRVLLTDEGGWRRPGDPSPVPVSDKGRPF